MFRNKTCRLLRLRLPLRLRLRLRLRIPVGMVWHLARRPVPEPKMSADLPPRCHMVRVHLHLARPGTVQSCILDTFDKLLLSLTSSAPSQLARYRGERSKNGATHSPRC